MIKAEDLVKGVFSKSSSARKTQATTIKRLIGGLRSFKFDEFGLDSKEGKCISDAISLLEQAAQMLKKAEGLKLKEEELRKKRGDEARGLVKSSPFGQLQSISERVALIASIKPHQIAWLRDESKYALSSLASFFEDVIAEISCDIAYGKEPLNEQLEKAWYKFQDKLPGLKQQHAALILRLQEQQAQAAAKP